MVSSPLIFKEPGISPVPSRSEPRAEWGYLGIAGHRHKGLERFFLDGDRRGIQTQHAGKLSRQLAVLNRATCPDDVNLPGWRLHPLKGRLAGHWAISVSGNWRLTFTFEQGDVVLLDYQDYH